MDGCGGVSRSRSVSVTIPPTALLYTKFDKKSMFEPFYSENRKKMDIF